MNGETLLAALKLIEKIAAESYEQDHKLRADGARSMKRIRDKAREAIERSNLK